MRTISLEFMSGFHAESGYSLDLLRNPSPCMMKGGLNGSSHSQHILIEKEGGIMTRSNGHGTREKPPYTSPPSMREVRMSEGRRGRVVASFFSGCGGSSLGYRMAGYEVRYACEFWPYAADCYEANSKITVDRRSICEVQPQDVLDACGLGVGELDVLDGSPPCQTFSMAGKRDMTDERTDLFFEWLRILEGTMPKAFISENVSGMVKGVAKGQFKRIVAEMRAIGYNVSARMLDAQWLGVPQQRQRIILLGVRKDLGAFPRHPDPLPYFYSVADACPWITDTSIQRGGHGWFPGDTRDISKRPSPTIAKGGLSAEYNLVVAPSRLKPGAYGGRKIRPNEPCNTITSSSPENDSILSIGRRDKQIIDGKSKLSMTSTVSPTRPCKCIVKTVNKYPQKFSPTESGEVAEYRKFTIAEVRRICSFPDDFRQEGSYANQWGVLGNSVPPLMMRAVAEHMADVLDTAEGKRITFIGEAPLNAESQANPVMGDDFGVQLAAHCGISVERLCAVAGFSNLVDWHQRRVGKGRAFATGAATRAAGNVAYASTRKLALLGRRVAREFGIADAPYFEAQVLHDCEVTVIPHPDDDNQWWNEPKNAAKFKAWFKLAVRA